MVSKMLNMLSMFTINDYTSDERRDLAEKVGCHHIYLWQCGKGLRIPSLPLADKLIDADARLTVKSLLAPKLARTKANKKKRK